MDTKTFCSNTFLESISNQHEIQQKRRKYDFVIESIRRIEKENFGSVGYQPKTYNPRAKKYSLKTNSRIRTRGKSQKKTSTLLSTKWDTIQWPSKERRPHKKKTAELGITCVNTFQIPKSDIQDTKNATQTDAHSHKIAKQSKIRELGSTAVVNEPSIWGRMRVLEMIKDLASQLSKNPQISDEKKFEAFGLLRKWKQNPNGPSLAREINKIVANGSKSREKETMQIEEKKPLSGTKRDFQPLKTGTLLKVVEDSKHLSGKRGSNGRENAGVPEQVQEKAAETEK